MEWDTDLRRTFLVNFEKNEIVKIQQEIVLALNNIGGNENIYESLQILFNEIKKDLLGDNKTKYNRMLGDLERTFKELILEFKNYCKSSDSPQDFNVYTLIWQYMRFIDFIESIKKFDPSIAGVALQNDYNKMIIFWDKVRDFIFTEEPWMEPRTKPWVNSFNNILNLGRRKRLGAESYYAKGLGELLRTLRNYSQHKKIFHCTDKSIEESFHNGFIQIFSIYVLSCYSYLELIKYWESNKKFIDELMAGKVR